MSKTSSRWWRWRLAAVGLAGLGLSVAGAARAADSPYDPRGGRDQAIVRNLHQQNQEAIAAARIAERRSTRDDVRDYATNVIRARETADAQLMEYAQGQAMNLPEIDTEAGALPHGSLAVARLTTATPERFDGEFVAFMNAQAQADADQARYALQLAQGPHLAALIADTLAPALADEQSGATNLAHALPPLPPPALQHPGDPSFASWTNTGADVTRGLAP